MFLLLLLLFCSVIQYPFHWYLLTSLLLFVNKFVSNDAPRPLSAFCLLESFVPSSILVDFAYYSVLDVHKILLEEWFLFRQHSFDASYFYGNPLQLSWNFRCIKHESDFIIYYLIFFDLFFRILSLPNICQLIYSSFSFRSFILTSVELSYYKGSNGSLIQSRNS